MSWLLLAVAVALVALAVAISTTRRRPVSPGTLNGGELRRVLERHNKEPIE